MRDGQLVLFVLRPLLVRIDFAADGWVIIAAHDDLSGGERRLS